MEKTIYDLPDMSLKSFKKHLTEQLQDEIEQARALKQTMPVRDREYVSGRIAGLEHAIKKLRA